MELLAAPIVLIAVVLYVAWPLLTEDESGARSLALEGEVEAVRREKQNLIESLKDLEMDFRMGKLSESDYRALSDHLEAEAVRTLRRLDELEKQPSPPGDGPQ